MVNGFGLPEQPAMISFSCPTCSESYRVSTDKAGKRTKCPGCGAQIVVPVTQSERDASALATERNVPMISFQCPKCRTAYFGPEDEVGEEFWCPKCKEMATVQAKRPELSREEPKNQDRKPAAPQSEPKSDASGEPWYYVFIDGYASLTAALGVIAGVFLVAGSFVGAAKIQGDAGVLLVFLGLVGGAILAVSGIFTSAILSLLVDIGRSLRAMRAPPQLKD